MAAALLRALAIIRDSLSDAELTRLIQSGNLDRLIREDVLARAFIPLRQRIRSTTERGFKFTVPDLPKGGKIEGVLSVSFDTLSPKVIEAIRSLEGPALDAIKADVKEVVRAFVENGLRDGRAPASVAREIRSLIGLAPHQEVWVQNLRAELESGKYKDAARRALIDRRFNLAKLDNLSASAKAERIDTIVKAYRKSSIALNTNTTARTLTLDSYKLGQSLSWADAKDKGVIPAGFQMMKQWIGMADDRERPEHLAMNNQVVPGDQDYSNGQSFAGEGDYGCRCLDRYFISRAV